MLNKWEVKPKIKDDLARIQPGFNKIILQLLANRNLVEKEAIENFFQASQAGLLDPFLFKDMKAAIDLAIKHIKQENLIVVYGDYDADGVTSVAVLVEILNTFKAKVQVYIPARISEGYGLNQKAIDRSEERRVGK